MISLTRGTVNSILNTSCFLTSSEYRHSLVFRKLQEYKIVCTKHCFSFIHLILVRKKCKILKLAQGCFPQFYADNKPLCLKRNQQNVLNHSWILNMMQICSRYSDILLVMQAKDKDGDFFPMWGTCQGFELMSVLVAKQNLLTAVDAEDLPLPLNFTTGKIYLMQSKVQHLMHNMD